MKTRTTSVNPFESSAIKSLCLAAIGAAAALCATPAQAQFDRTVGVIPEIPYQCPQGSRYVSIYMDDEDDRNENLRTGWTGAISQTAQGTTMGFCAVQGFNFHVHPGISYAVLLLGDTCPTGSNRMTREFNNENSNNKNTSSGDIFPNRSDRSSTTLVFCHFQTNHGITAPTLPKSDYFANLGVPYGVFTGAGTQWVLESGSVHTDDEDGWLGGNVYTSRLVTQDCRVRESTEVNWCGMVADSDVSQWISGRDNTTMLVAKVSTGQEVDPTTGIEDAITMTDYSNPAWPWMRNYSYIFIDQDPYGDYEVSAEWKAELYHSDGAYQLPVVGNLHECAVTIPTVLPDYTWERDASGKIRGNAFVTVTDSAHWEHKAAMAFGVAHKPNRPSLQIQQTSGNSLTLGFYSAGAQQYALYYQGPTTLPQGASPIMVGAGGSITLTSLQMDGEYTFTVAAQGTQGTSDLSRAVAHYVHSTAYLSPTTPNIAPLATRSVDSTYSGYDVARIVDGSRNTETSPTASWTNAYSPSAGVTLPNNVDFGFSSERWISRVDLYTSLLYPIKDYQIQYRKGSLWETLVTVTGNVQAYRMHGFGPVKTSAIRIVATSGPTTQPTYARLNEVEIYESANIALGALVSAQSTFAGYSATKINDGDFTTTVGGNSSWCNAHTSQVDGVLPQYVDISFGSTKAFSRIEIFSSTGFVLQDYALQYWNGTKWQTLESVVGNTSVSRATSFATISAPKVRIISQKGPANQPAYARINEVAIY